MKFFLIFSLLILNTFMGGEKAWASTKKIVEECISTQNLDWFVKVTDNGNGSYKIENYKLGAFSQGPGTENYRVVYSIDENVGKREIEGAALYGGEEDERFTNLQLSVAAPVAGERESKADFYRFNHKTGDYDHYLYTCKRNL